MSLAESGSDDDIRQEADEFYPEYDGPSAPPVFVVLEKDLESHELRSNKLNLSKKISDPLKRGFPLQKKGSALSRTSKVSVLYTSLHSFKNSQKHRNSLKKSRILPILSER